jgi:hypothetical protein
MGYVNQMTKDYSRKFKFGLEAEFLLIDAVSFRPLWHPDLTFAALNTLLEAIPVDDFERSSRLNTGAGCIWPSSPGCITDSLL